MSLDISNECQCSSCTQQRLNEKLLAAQIKLAEEQAKAIYWRNQAEEKSAKEYDVTQAQIDKLKADNAELWDIIAKDGMWLTEALKKIEAYDRSHDKLRDARGELFEFGMKLRKRQDENAPRDL